MTQEEVVAFWKKASDKDWDFAMELYVGGKRYDYALFFVHLSLEKLLKAIHYHRKDSHPLAIHDLAELARRAGLEIDQEFEKRLKEITTFNIAARYDSYKLSFYNKAKKPYADTWINIAKEVRKICLKTLS
ncbi:MAG: HEPN domain-containing protein [Microgenomates group bacterium Gr01-1014_16]|nr:MAG: HEPN domain-containing protein [Microgenomates group bacterium Gr01-1014_16]